MAQDRALVRVGGKAVTAVRSNSTSDWRVIVAKFVSAQDVRESSRNLYARTLSLFFEWIGERAYYLANHTKEEETPNYHKFLCSKIKKATEREEVVSTLVNEVAKELTREDILSYKDYLQENEGLASLTVGSYIVAVRKFYEWAEAYKLYPNIAKGVKTPRRKQAFKKQHLTDSKSAELLEHFQSLSLRDFAIVNLILRTGLRTIEVVRADIGDITFKGERRVLKVWGKGHDEKDDFVVLSDKTYLPIANYLATRKGAKAKEPLFVSNSRQNKGERLTTRTISGLCKDGLRAIGMDGKEFTAHSLRHTTAVAILKHGGSITDVQSVLRHSSPVTSEIYTESVKEELRLQQAPEMMLDGAF